MSNIEIRSKQIVMVSIEQIIEHPKNANRHSVEQIERLCKLIKYQNFRSPLIISNLSGFLVSGHGRKMAAEKLGMTELPCVYQDFKDEAQEYAYVISENEIARWAELDKHLVYTELKDLDLDDIELLGLEDFEIPDIDVLDPQTDEDEVPEIPPEPITKRGDVWLLGKHRLMCGDSTMIDDVERLMSGEKAELLFTDPPYNQNVGLTGNKDGSSMSNRQEKLKESNLNDFDPEEFLNVVTYLDVDSVYIFHSKDLIAGYIEYFNQIKRNWELLAMTKPSVMPFRKGHYLSDIEWMIFSKKKSVYFNELLDNAYYSKFRSARTVREKENWHPTRKDIEYIEAYILISSEKSVLDLFGGSGTTLIACEKNNRINFSMELDEKYCDVIINRYQNYTGKTATLESTGELYNDLKVIQNGE